MADSKMADSDVHPVLAEDVASSMPPPSYEEVMGQFMTSVKQTQDCGQEELPTLSYIDIMPRLLDPGNMKEQIPPTFQKFSDIMNGGNLWLKNNPGVKVWKCETVERKVEAGPVVHLDSTIHHESSYGVNHYVFGVRLWLTQRLNPADPIQELGLLNLPPPIKEVPVAIATPGFGMMGMKVGLSGNMGTLPMMVGFGRRGGVRVMTQGVLQTYENLSKAVEEYNEYVKEEPLQGSILNVETTSVKFGDGFAGTEADPDVTSWYEKGKGKAFSTRRFTKILRIFYVKGPPRHEQLSMQTFLPRVLKQPEGNRCAQFEKFDDVLQKVQQWLQTQSGIRVVNLETRDAKYTHGFGQPVTIEDESTDDIITSLREENMVRFLRVFYVSQPDLPSYQSTVLTSRLFVPMAQGGRRFESMGETMFRVNVWLKYVGLPLFSVETVPFLLTVTNNVITDRTDFKHSQKVGNYWLTCVRLYFPQPYQEPPSTSSPQPHHPPPLPAPSCEVSMHTQGCRLLWKSCHNKCMMT